MYMTLVLRWLDEGEMVAGDSRVLYNAAKQVI